MAMLVVLGMVLGACVSAPTPSTPAETGEAPTPAEKVFRWGLPGTINNFNPFTIIQGIQQWVQRNVVGYLVLTDADGNIIPELAESWTFSEDGTSVTFKLREGVTWHDGEPFTAEDVVFTFEYLLKPEVGATTRGNFLVIQGAEAYGAGETDTISGITANGDYEVTFTLNEPSAVFMLYLTGQPIVPKHVVSQIPPAEFANSDFATKRPYPGTGPYIFVNYKADQEIELQANPNYWRGKPIIDRFYYEFFPDVNTLLVALERGEIDATGNVPAAELARIKELPNLNVAVGKGAGINLFFINSNQAKEGEKQRAILTPEFRKALIHALDVETLINETEYGLPTPTNCLYMAAWACPDDLESFPYDPEKAKALLAQAGWNPDWELELMFFSATGEATATIEVMQQMWAAVGLKVKLIPADGPRIVADFYTADNFDVHWSGTAPGADPHTVLNNFAVCGRLYPQGYNGTRYCNQQVTDLIAEGARTVDQAQRAEIYKEIQRILNKELPLIPLWRWGQILVTNKRVTNITYVPYGWDNIHLWDVE